MDHNGDMAGRRWPADRDRLDLTRLLAGLRHLTPSPEPARVFAELATVCVPALCDQCLIQITEQDRCPYRIRRTWPATPVPASMTDEEFTAAVAGRGTVLDGNLAGGAIVEVVEAGNRAVVARFANPPGGGPAYRGVLIARWADADAPDDTMAGLVGVVTDHAVALVHRERTTSAVDRDVAAHVESALNGAQRVAAASGILAALYHLSPPQVRQLLHRASEHTHRPILDVANTVLRTGALPEIRPPRPGRHLGEPTPGEDTVRHPDDGNRSHTVHRAP
jgi:hypothetical protein